MNLYDKLNELRKQADYLKVKIRSSKLSSILDIPEWWRVIGYDKAKSGKFTVVAARKGGKVVFYQNVDKELLEQLLKYREIMKKTSYLVNKAIKRNNEKGGKKTGHPNIKMMMEVDEPAF